MTMRVLFATSKRYLPQVTGGVETATHELARALQARGHTVGVLARLRAGGPLAWANAIRRRLVPTVRVPSDHAMGYPVFRGPGTIPDVTEVVARFRPDVAVVLPGHPVPMLQRCLALGVPTVLYQQDVLFDELGGVLAPDPRLAVVANSRFTASRLESRFGVHADVFPPFVDAERYRVAPRGREVLFVGLVAMKGVEVAFRIAESRRDIPFVFVESWPLPRETFESLRRRAAALGNVTVRRGVRDMRTLYRRARVLLVPSQVDEAWGRVVTEAQASGIPVLASDRGGLPESVGAGGVLVAPDAPVATWTEALARLWDDPSEHARLAAAALAHAARADIRMDALVEAFIARLEAHRRACATQR